jgi:hypothetical protein
VSVFTALTVRTHIHLKVQCYKNSVRVSCKVTADSPKLEGTQLVIKFLALLTRTGLSASWFIRNILKNGEEQKINRHKAVWVAPISSLTVYTNLVFMDTIVHSEKRLADFPAIPIPIRERREPSVHIIGIFHSY